MSPRVKAAVDESRQLEVRYSYAQEACAEYEQQPAPLANVSSSRERLAEEPPGEDALHRAYEAFCTSCAQDDSSGITSSCGMDETTYVHVCRDCMLLDEASCDFIAGRIFQQVRDVSQKVTSPDSINLDFEQFCLALESVAYMKGLDVSKVQSLVIERAPSILSHEELSPPASEIDGVEDTTDKPFIEEEPQVPDFSMEEVFNTYLRYCRRFMTKPFADSLKESIEKGEAKEFGATIMTEPGKGLMEGSSFYALCKDHGLLGKRAFTGEAAFIFDQVKEHDADRQICFAKFQEAIHLIAKARMASSTDLFRMLARSEGPDISTPELDKSVQNQFRSRLLLVKQENSISSFARSEGPKIKAASSSINESFQEYGLRKEDSAPSFATSGGLKNKASPSINDSFQEYSLRDENSSPSFSRSTISGHNRQRRQPPKTALQPSTSPAGGTGRRSARRSSEVRPASARPSSTNIRRRLSHTAPTESQLQEDLLSPPLARSTGRLHERRQSSGPRMQSEGRPTTTPAGSSASKTSVPRSEVRPTARLKSTNLRTSRRMSYTASAESKMQEDLTPASATNTGGVRRRRQSSAARLQLMDDRLSTSPSVGTTPRTPGPICSRPAFSPRLSSLLGHEETVPPLESSESLQKEASLVYPPGEEVQGNTITGPTSRASTNSGPHNIPTMPLSVSNGDLTDSYQTHQTPSWFSLAFDSADDDGTAQSLQRDNTMAAGTNAGKEGHGMKTRAALMLDLSSEASISISDTSSLSPREKQPSPEKATTNHPVASPGTPPVTESRGGDRFSSAAAPENPRVSDGNRKDAKYSLCEIRPVYFKYCLHSMSKATMEILGEALQAGEIRFCNGMMMDEPAKGLMENSSFYKLCVDNALLGNQALRGEATSIFDQVKEKADRTINFRQFQRALYLISRRRNAPLAEIFQVVASCEGPKPEEI